MIYENTRSVPVRVAERTPPQRETALERRALHEVNAALLGAELAELTRAELAVIAPLPNQLPLPAEVFQALRARNVRVRLLYTAGDKPPAEPLASLVRNGIALPAPGRVPHFLVVRDRAVVYLPSQEILADRHDRLTRIRSIAMGDCLGTAFGLLWESALQRVRAVRTGGCNAEGEELLRVLGSGLTDDQAAGVLHMSKRTFARRVSDMMSRLDANTRFQAGVNAVRRGLI